MYTFWFTHPLIPQGADGRLYAESLRHEILVELQWQKTLLRESLDNGWIDRDEYDFHMVRISNEEFECKLTYN